MSLTFLLFNACGMCFLWAWALVSPGPPRTSAAIPAPTLTPAIVKSWACPDPGGAFTVFFQLKLIVKNNAKVPIVVPLVSNVVYDVTIADTPDDFRTGNIEIQIEPDVFSVGRPRDFRANDFAIIRPSEGIELPILIEIGVPAIRRGADRPGFALPGEKWMRFTWDPWSEEESITRRWAEFFSQRGQLVLDPITSEPISISIPATPTFASCGAESLPRIAGVMRHLPAGSISRWKYVITTM